MATKHACFPAQFKALGETDGVGRVEAIVSVFGNVDHVGDRVVKGAFAKSIARWKTSGDRVPVILSHQWGDIWSHIGETESLEETSKGLKAVYTLDIADNPVAAQVYRLMKRRTLKEHSFAYEVKAEAFENGANELRELELIEIGPTLKGVNPETELLAVKAAVTDGNGDEPDSGNDDDPDEETGDDETDDTLEDDDDEKADIPDGVKAGRRISKDTETRLRAAITSMRALSDEVESILGTDNEAGDEPKGAVHDDNDVIAALAELEPESGTEKKNDDTARTTGMSGDNPTGLLLQLAELEVS